MPDMQLLTCEAGHEWTRPSQRGRPPRFCPDHVPPPEEAPAKAAFLAGNGDNTNTAPAIVEHSGPRPTVELWCEAGQHKWNRLSQRGRKPISCPDHTVPRDSPSGEGAGPQRAAKASNATEQLCERALDVQDSLNDPEQRRQIDYIVTRLLTMDALAPKDDEHRRKIKSDTDMLSDRLKDIIRERKG